MGRKTVLWLMGVLCVLTFCASPSLYAQKQQTKKRAKTSRKARVKDERVYLVHADVLHFDQYKNPDATILNGKVHFTHVGEIGREHV